MRVVSLLPSGTEVLALLASKRTRSAVKLVQVELIGRSHECDYPADFVKGVEVLTSQLTTFTSSRDIDDQVRDALRNNKSLYNLNVQRLMDLKPDVVITQSLCNVCSIDFSFVESVCSSMDPTPKIVSLNPFTLSDILQSILDVGAAIGLQDEASKEVNSLQSRINICKDFAVKTDLPRRRVGFIEWIDPIYVGGHWTPEIISLSGQDHVLNSAVGSKSFAVDSDFVREQQIDVLVVCPCGLDLQKTEELVVSEMLGKIRSDWKDQKFVTENQIFLVDGNQMFNRPGPRLVECLEWMTWLFNIHLNSSSSDLNFNFDFEKFPWKQFDLNSSRDASKSRQTLQLDIEELDRIASEKEESTYIDPKTGYTVFTSFASKKRGYCCGQGCRHCVYGHVNVDSERKGDRDRNKIIGNQIISASKRNFRKSKCHILKIIFWSGGKDSFLTLLSVLEEMKQNKSKAALILLTTFDETSQIVPIQDISMHDIMAQYKSLHCKLMSKEFPWVDNLFLYPSSRSHEKTPVSIADIITLLGASVEATTLYFGDLHIEDIRAWRETTFSEYNLAFPLFKVPYETLAQRLETSALLKRIQISASSVPQLKVGGEFNHQKLLQQHPDIDSFGENGEFHTKCLF